MQTKTTQDGLWQAVLGEIELSVSHGSYVTWFKNTRLLKQTPEEVVVGVPNVFIKEQLEKRHHDQILAILTKNGLSPATLTFKVHSSLVPTRKTEDQEELVLTNPTAPQATAPRLINATPSLSHSYRQGLNERYTFESFIVGSGNELAYAACQAIAATPGTKYNPLFLYGGVGIGKTHLIQAVGNEVLKSNPKATIVYASTEQFLQEFVDALRFKKTTDFAKHYRSADVLIVDDMQFIAGKEKMQEEFFHTFNALHQANKQIIISSDKPPKDIPTLEDRLRSRFAWGMVIDMQNPDFETRCAILQVKAGAMGVELPHDVVEFLSNQAPSNIRELEGALNHLLASCEMRKVEPSLSAAVALFGGRQRPKHITSKIIVERVAKHFGVEMVEILGPKRDKDIVVPRQIAMYFLRTELHLSFPRIAEELGRKDHTTAMHSIDKIQTEQAFDPSLKEQLDLIKERLYA